MEDIDLTTASASNPAIPVPGYNLLDLQPDLISKIFGYLDYQSLKNLRHVCQFTDDLVCSGAFYKKTKVYIGDKKRLNDVILSNHPWENFILFEENEKSHLELRLPFLERFRPTMRQLEVRGTDFCLSGILQFLGQQLNSLYFNVQCDTDEEDEWNTANELAEIPMEWFLRLRHLNLEIRGFSDAFLYCMRNICVAFMENCPNLVSLKFPMAFSTSCDDMDFLAIRATDESAKPLIEFLKRKAITSTGKPSRPNNNIVIDFCSVRGLFSYGEPMSPFPLTITALIQLAKLCERIGGQLYNIPTHALPYRKSITFDEMECLNRAVASLHSFNYQLMDLRNMFIPPNAAMDVEVQIEGSASADPFPVERRDETLDLPVEMNISAINVRCDYATRRNTPSVHCGMIINELLDKRRESVKKVYAKMQIYDTNPWNTNLNNAFPNLRELYLETVLHYQSIELPNHDLIHLRDLTIVGASLDFERLGSFTSSMRRLDHLHLMNVGVNGLNCCTFENFHPRKPKTFVFVPSLRHSTIVDVKFLQLKNTLESPDFMNTVETLVCFIPVDSTGEQMTRLLDFLKKYKKLKNDQPWEKKYMRIFEDHLEFDEVPKLENCFGNLIPLEPKYEYAPSTKYRPHNQGEFDDDDSSSSDDDDYYDSWVGETVSKIRIMLKRKHDADKNILSNHREEVGRDVITQDDVPNKEWENDALDKIESLLNEMQAAKIDASSDDQEEAGADVIHVSNKSSENDTLDKIFTSIIMEMRAEKFNVLSDDRNDAGTADILEYGFIHSLFEGKDVPHNEVGLETEDSRRRFQLRFWISQLVGLPPE